MDIGQKIKAARLEKRMTQEELGEILGVKKSAVAKYEAGRVVNLKRDTIQKLAKALDMRPSDFIFEGNPEATADLHARMLTDMQVVSMVKEYFELSRSDQNLVRAFTHSLFEKSH